MLLDLYPIAALTLSYGSHVEEHRAEDVWKTCSQKYAHPLPSFRHALEGYSLKEKGPEDRSSLSSPVHLAGC